jgi:arylsulfatase A-like enzyme
MRASRKEPGPGGRFLFVTGLASIAIVGILLACAPPDRPHLLLVTVDTLRADYLSSYGYDRPTTPAIDALLAGGTRFERVLAPVPRTTQSLASLLTGAYPHGHGVRVLFDRLASDVPYLPELARAVGYQTVAVVSNHVLTGERGLDRGFTTYDAAPDARGAAATTRAALRHLDATPMDEGPLFVWVHYIDPHMPYYPPLDLVDAFDPGYTGRYRSHFGSQPGGVGPQAYPAGLGKERVVFANPLSDEENAHVRRLYAADIRQVDDAIGDLLAGLRERFGPDWLVVFTSDHGESLGEHDFSYDHGDYVYNPSLHVPLGIVLPPGQEKGPESIDEWVSLVDVAPTVAELLGVELEGASVEGRSLVPYLRGVVGSSEPVFAETGKSFFPHRVKGRVQFDVAGRPRAVVQAGWKLIWLPGQTEDRRYELYDLEQDPGETRNLYRADHPEVAGLLEALNAWYRAPEGGSAQPTAEDREHLRSLGYIE